MGKGSNTTVSTNTPAPEAMAAYREAIGRAETVSNTPWVSYGGELVAGLNSTQQGGIQGANDSTTGWQPYMGAATGALQQVNPNINAEQFSGDAVNKYMSPYMDQVVNSTMANLNRSNQISQQGLKSGAIKSGAFGGDRAGIASANMSREQGLATGQTLGGLLQSGYGQALGEFNNQQQTNLSADQANAARWMQLSQQIAGLGQQQQQQTIAGSNQQLAAGQVQQQTQQAQDEAAYRQFQIQRAYPFQTAGWYANIAQGIGGQMGGTTVTQGPQPNAAGQVAGGIGAVASMASMFARGGAVNDNDEEDYPRHLGYAAGGAPGAPNAPSNPFGDVIGWVPAGPLTSRGASFPGAPQGGSGQKSPDVAGQLKAGQATGKELVGAFKKVRDKISDFGHDPMSLISGQDTTPATLGTDMAPNPDISGSTWGYADGGGVFGDDGGFVPAGPLTSHGASFPGAPQGSGGQKSPDIAGQFKAGTTAGKDIGNAAKSLGNKFSSFGGSSPMELQGSQGTTNLGDTMAPNPSEMPDMPDMVGMASGGAVADYSPSDDDLDIAARTVLGEGRGEPEEGQRAILHVMRNRRAAGNYGPTVRDVALAPKQFSAWNKGDPNRSYMEGLDTSDPRYVKAKEMASKVLGGQDEDLTNGAKNFYNPKTVRPKWAEGQEIMPIGNHDFLTAGGPNARPMAYAADDTPRRSLPSRAPPSAPRALGHNDNEPAPQGSLLSRLTGFLGADRPKSDNGEKKSILESLTGIKLTPEGQQGLLAASLGMMGNPSPFWGVQLGQGGMEGIKAYNEAKKVNAGVENTQAASRSTSMDAGNKSLVQTPGGNFMRMADGSMMPLDEYLDLAREARKAGRSPPPIMGTVPSNTQVERANTAAGSPAPPMPLPARPAVVESGRRADAPAPPVAPLAPDARPLAPGAAPVAGTDQSRVSPNGTPGAPYSYQPEIGAQSQEEIKAEKARNTSGPSTTLTMAAETGQKMRNEVNNDYAAAIALRQNLNDLSRSVMKLPREGGFLVAGSKFDTRAEIGKLVNTVMRASGRPDLQLDPAAVAQGDIQSKLTSLMGQLGAAAGHQTAYDALQVISKNVPSGNMSPEAAAKLLSELYTNQQRSIDRHKYVNEYVKQVNGPAQFALSSFERDHPMSKYEKEKKTIEQIMLKRGKDKEGKDRYMVDDVYNFDPRVVDEKTKSPYISRYFVGG